MIVSSKTKRVSNFAVSGIKDLPNWYKKILYLGVKLYLKLPLNLTKYPVPELNIL